MLTKPLGSYLLVSRCKSDPSDSFPPKGGVRVFLDAENLEKTGDNYVIPVAVIAVGTDAKYGIKPGDVVYANPRFMFQTVIEGGIYFLVNEGFLFQVLPHEHARTAGAVAAPCPQPQFQPKIARAVSQEVLQAAAKAAGIALP